MKNGKVILGVLAGLAAGAMLGILFAPDKGVETRKKIAKKGKDYADDISEKVHNLVEEVSEKVDQAIKDLKHAKSANQEKSSVEM